MILHSLLLWGAFLTARAAPSTSASSSATAQPTFSTSASIYSPSTPIPQTPAVGCIVTTLAGGFNQPRGVAVNGEGTAFVADWQNKVIRAVSPNGTVTTRPGWYFGINQSPGPSGVAVDAANNVYVADSANHMICIVALSGTITTLAGGGGSAPCGASSFPGWSGSTNGVGAGALFYGPSGVVVGASGTVFVADPGNHKIREITPAGVVTTLAGGSVSGTTLGSTDGVGSAALFNYPSGIGMDARGIVYVTDQGNNKVRAITPAGVVTTLAGGSVSGTANGISDGVGTAALFAYVSGCIGVDAWGILYLTDNNRLRAITTPAGVVTTLAGGSVSGTALGYADGVGTAALFLSPIGATFARGVIYVTDNGNGLLRKISNCSLISSCPAGFFCPSNSSIETPQLCPPGHFCPAGATKWNDRNCGEPSPSLSPS